MARTFFFKFPKLSFEVSNNSKSVVFISEIRLRVLKSEVDNSVIPVIHENVYWPGSFFVVNEGWGAMRNVTIDITKWNSPLEEDSLSLESQIGERQHAIDHCAGDFDSSLRKPYRAKVKAIDPSMPSEGPLRFNSDTPFWDVHQDRRFGDLSVDVFPNIPNHDPEAKFLCAYGVLSYTSNDSARYNHLSFRTLIRLNRGGFGEMVLPSADYNIKLQAGEKDYTLSVPVSQKITPGDVDYFLLTVASDKTATYSIEYTPIDAGGIKLKSKIFSLKVFVPRLSRSELVDEKPIPLPIVAGGELSDLERLTMHSGTMTAYLRKEVTTNNCKQILTSLMTAMKGDAPDSRPDMIQVQSPTKLACYSTLQTETE